MNISILIPVKSPKKAKSRLNGFLSARERYNLAWSLFRHVLNTCIRTTRKKQISVLSNDPEILTEASMRGVLSVMEKSNTGLNGALKIAIQDRTNGVLILPTDLPLLRPEDINAIIKNSASNKMIISPDKQRHGTNALLLQPSDLVPLNFGNNSFQIHCELAKKVGVNPYVLERKNLAFDLDTFEDFLYLTKINNISHLNIL